MFSGSAVKKFQKFVRDPNLFFYDMFRKKISDRLQVSGTVGSTIELECKVDASELRELGLSAYLKKHLGGVYGPRDGADTNSLLISSDKLYWLLAIVFQAQQQLRAVVDLYTPGGSASARFNAKDIVDQNAVLMLFRSRSDLVCELMDGKDSFVSHVYLYDSVDGVGMLRSNNVWQKKIVSAVANSYFRTSEVPNAVVAIDAVYTWVNQSDPQWQALWKSTFPNEVFDPDRFTSNDELRYSLRSVEKYAPWINKIYIVSNCSQPEWLADVSRIQWVSHEDIFPDPANLPTFSSHAIEACLHRIPDLGEQFIYFNDDFILNQPCLPSDFFDQAGRSLSYFEPYGMVDQDEPDTDQTPDYLHASKNSSKLISDAFPAYRAKNLHRHIPYAMQKSVLEMLENWVPDAFDKTRRARRRDRTDVNVTSYLYHHYAMATGNAVSADASYLIVRPGNIQTLFGRDFYKHKFLCFNDGAGSSSDKLYKSASIEFYKKRFSFTAKWEQV